MNQPKTQTAAEEVAERFERVLAPDMQMFVGGELKRAGDTVSLTRQQIDRLEPEGYFEPVGGKKRGDSR